ncbi:hypothetical protein Acr_11g0007470 [Actinidia rufa]|uniref:Transposase (putative) gypsy type domain-containing protein n=1 Tax=Actinidia rufa TaxID=165716 RepID=A0A7J0FCN9_9ERIC|nr:hypothetical protein Acr_11g0007470 [Actinidia rufa]
MGKRLFYSWRRNSHVRKLRRDPQVAKYRKRSRRYWSNNGRMPYGECSTIIGDVMEKKVSWDCRPYGDGVLWQAEYSASLIGDVGLKSRAHRCWRSKHWRCEPHIGVPPQLYSLASAVEIYTLALTFTLPLSSRACLLALEPIRLPEEGETIMSACLSEVAFYEAAFHASLPLPIHPSIRMILHFYNIYPIQLIPNAWHSVVCATVLWRYHKVAFSLTKFRNLFGLYKNPKPNIPDGWLSREAGALRVPRSWGILGKRYNKVPIPFKDEHNFLNNILSSVSRGGDKSDDVLAGETAPIADDKGEGEVRDPILDLGLLSLSSSPKSRSESWSDLGFPPNLDQMVEESKSESSVIKPTLAKGVVISKKHPGDESNTSLSKKGNATKSPKGKDIVLPPEPKKVAKPYDAARDESYSLC